MRWLINIKHMWWRKKKKGFFLGGGLPFFSHLFPQNASCWIYLVNYIHNLQIQPVLWKSLRVINTLLIPLSHKKMPLQLPPRHTRCLTSCTPQLFVQINSAPNGHSWNHLGELHSTYWLQSLRSVIEMNRFIIKHLCEEESTCDSSSAPHSWQCC